MVLRSHIQSSLQLAHPCCSLRSFGGLVVGGGQNARPRCHASLRSPIPHFRPSGHSALSLGGPRRKYLTVASRAGVACPWKHPGFPHSIGMLWSRWLCLCITVSLLGMKEKEVGYKMGEEEGVETALRSANTNPLNDPKIYSRRNNNCKKANKTKTKTNKRTKDS